MKSFIEIILENSIHAYFRTHIPKQFMFLIIATHSINSAQYGRTLYL